ncbi:G-protein gamma subunit [Pseudozyma hubeiensis SY62]|uniref:G-protein gamma subunit n=1 Tax=Pseudozyma hubeiensis (strain SY62) TaxID=1305764 RepID=R9NZZ4_PSEHS|nr:G-protein gamma subunit [Pseudozyma hubeiensis SY62]GAC94307.1 G-protein gamma subunit [Pseudozyma hubeiensis SY62]
MNVKPHKQSMSELKLRRLTEHNQRLKEDLDRPRIRVSEASQSIYGTTSNMTIADSFWSFARLSEPWTSAAPPPKPRRRTAVYTQQHIETIGGGSTDVHRIYPSDIVRGHPRLPVELIVHIVLVAAQDNVASSRDTRSQQLLELARVSRTCHRAIFSMHLLPDVHLYGLQQIRSFALSLDDDRIGIRALARSRVRNLTVRARSLISLEHGYGPALFDASQAQTHFEKDLVPFIRIILSHCHGLQTLHLEGVPRGLQSRFAQTSAKLGGYSCLMGHYGADLDRGFWLAQRWNELEDLQLHGPRFRFTTNTAATLAHLPKLKRLGLVVPVIVPTLSSSEANGEGAGIELDLSGSVNPLQLLIDRCSNLELLLLVGHAEKDYVGYIERYRYSLRRLRRPRRSEKIATETRLRLVTSLRRYNTADEHDTVSPKGRVHPCEVSSWMMGRAQRGLHWFEDEEQHRSLDHIVESFELADHPSSVSTSVPTATTSALMSRTGSITPASVTAASRNARTTDDALRAVDLLLDADEDDEGSSDES